MTEQEIERDMYARAVALIEERYPTMKTKIRFSGVVARSTFMRVPVALHSPRSAAAEDYGILVNEYLDMIGGKE